LSSCSIEQPLSNVAKASTVAVRLKGKVGMALKNRGFTNILGVSIK
jgi:hypothetical protein